MLRIGDLLVAAKLVTMKDIDAAVKQQIARGGRLGDNLVELGAIGRESLEAFLQRLPKEPSTLADTGIPESDLLNLLIKLIYVSRLETVSQYADAIKLPRHLVLQLVQSAIDRMLLAAVGTAEMTGLSDQRYTITDTGRRWAVEALAHSQYSGPAPVSLESFAERVRLQKVTNELVSWDRIRGSFEGLTITDAFVEQMGPAINSGRAILLYGPPGNGKTSIALRLRHVFSDVIYIPYAVMVEGQIMRVFDPSVHEVPSLPGASEEARGTVRREGYDARWQPSHRPFVIAGGELTLEMLDLSYNATANFYEAPLHVKALGGCFIIDDFGRQLVAPTSLLNRWIVPLESRVDYLKLHTGKSFSLPFEELVLFSTNLEPEDLMDPAFLRRLPYKLEIGGPSEAAFNEIFAKVSKDAGLAYAEAEFKSIVTKITQGKGLKLANFQPKFIIEQVLAACRFMDMKPHFEPRFVEYSINNLKVNRSDDPGPTQAQKT